MALSVLVISFGQGLLSGTWCSLLMSVCADVVCKALIDPHGSYVRKLTITVRTLTITGPTLEAGLFLHA